MNLGPYVRATSLGWLLGLPLVAVLALVGEGVGLGGVQVFVGLGMGAAVGLLQSRALRPLLARHWRWFAASLALSVPFLATDVFAALAVGPRYSLAVCVTLGGLLVGALQAALLPTTGLGRARWVVASLIGWSLAGATAELANALVGSHSLRGVGGALTFLALTGAGGPLLGLITGLGGRLPALTPRAR